jgi:hypothetical protein
MFHLYISLTLICICYKRMQYKKLVSQSQTVLTIMYNRPAEITFVYLCSKQGTRKNVSNIIYKSYELKIKQVTLSFV